MNGNGSPWGAGVVGARAPYTPPVPPPGRRAPVIATAQGLVKAPPAPDAPTHPLVGEALERFETVVGGRARLVHALVAGAADADRDLAFVIKWIANPANDARKLSVVCREASINFGEVLEAFKRGDGALAYMAALAHVHEKTPAVAKDVMDRALPHAVECPVCLGAKTVLLQPRKGPRPTRPLTATCERCKGVGTITEAPDLKHQKFALSLGPLAPEKNAPAVVIDQRTQVGGDASSPHGLARLLAATDRILHGPRSVPGTVIPPDTP